MNPEKLAQAFFFVLDDLREFLPDLTIVGGWLPFIYSKFIWEKPIGNLITTADIDFGLDHSIAGIYPKTVFEILLAHKYNEKHIKLGHSTPVVLHKGKVPLEFITYPEARMVDIQKMLGTQIHVNKIENFDFLLRYRISIPVRLAIERPQCVVCCPKPSAFIYHKAAGLRNRDMSGKTSKDLFYIYYVLRHAPDLERIMKEISNYQIQDMLPDVSDNINHYFERISSQGCIMVEKENGPDEFILNLKQDIFDRFNKLKSILSK